MWLSPIFWFCCVTSGNAFVDYKFTWRMIQRYSEEERNLQQLVLEKAIFVQISVSSCFFFFFRGKHSIIKSKRPSICGLCIYWMVNSRAKFHFLSYQCKQSTVVRMSEFDVHLMHSARFCVTCPLTHIAYSTTVFCEDNLLQISAFVFYAEHCHQEPQQKAPKKRSFKECHAKTFLFMGIQ
ncbi:uncharacterized protein BYT42DRAFT_393314 [Radiomyces spectabilis]|uniref:uncharacterized protein n=1 Tax=Radiomyces spectabilis TaxID=64574 RepID=UPI00221F5013|nr:uncharacterized protein BYT42DRAFT_393314 [Radiomyces spectabilis]KAI8374169.1 hypothetical protein BYT42DRAFT_393314 [Radiomyces spectabilis]